MKNTLLCKCLALFATQSNKKNTTRFNGLLALFLVVMGMGVSWGQTTIASDGLNNSTTLFTFSGGLYYTGNTSSTADSPASSAYAVEGTHSRGIANGTAILTSSNINTTGYSSVQMAFRLASYSIGSTGNGVDNGDIVTVEVSPNGGTNYYSTVRVVGNSNARWSWSSGTGNALTAYDGNDSFVEFASGAGNATTTGYSTVTITSLPVTSNLRIRVTLLNDNTNERWLLDDFKVTGTLSATPSIALSSPSQIAAGNVNHGTTSHILSNFQAAVTVANATLNSIAVVTGGTYATNSHVSNYKLMYNASSNTFGSAMQIGTTQSSVAQGNTVTFSSLNTAITSGNTGYFWVIADISSVATDSQTINIVASPSLTFASGTPTGSISAGGAQTFVAVTPNIAISSNHPLATNINQNTTNQVFGSIALAVTTANAALNSIAITTAGTTTATAAASTTRER